MPATSVLHRLDPHNIKSGLVRADFYREIRKGNPFWNEYEIRPDEIQNPELTAYRIYGVNFDSMKWIVAVVTGLDDLRQTMVSGQRYRFPSSVWIRQKIREYMKRETL